MIEGKPVSEQIHEYQELLKGAELVDQYKDYLLGTGSYAGQLADGMSQYTPIPDPNRYGNDG